MDALGTLRRLRAFGSNMDLNWEFILSVQYRNGLGAIRRAVDVGAHEGMHAAQLALIAEHLVCFEPIPHLAARLRAALPAAQVEAVALGAKAASASFFINQRSAPESGLKPRLDAGDDQFDEISVPVRRLDDYALTDVDFLKIDCEGGELDILLGAEVLLRDCRPVIAMEYGWNGFLAYGWEKGSLYDLARRQGYVVCDLFGNPFDTPEIYDACVGCYYWDYLLIPAERCDLVARIQESGQRVLADLPRFAFAKAALTA